MRSSSRLTAIRNRISGILSEEWGTTMQLATVLTPMSDENLQLAAQCGVTDVEHPYPGTDAAA